MMIMMMMMMMTMMTVCRDIFKACRVQFSPISFYKSKGISLCLCVYVWVRYPEILNMAAVWFKGVQHRICLDYTDTSMINKLFHKCFSNSASIAKCSIVMCAPEPITAHHSHVRTRTNHCTP